MRLIRLTLTVSMLVLAPSVVSGDDNSDAERDRTMKALAQKYTLAKGQLVRRFAPPFLKEREAWIRVRKGEPRRASLLFGVNDEGIVDYGFRDIRPLYSLIEYLGYPPQFVEGNAKEAKLSGDFVFRRDAMLERMLPQLLTVLRRDCKLPVKIRFVEAKRPVIVVSGEYHLKKPESKDNDIVVYAHTEKANQPGSHIGFGIFDSLLSDVGSFINMPMISEVAQPPRGIIKWRFVHPFAKVPTKNERRMILQHLNEQTGLQFKEEVRKVRLMRVDRVR